MKTKLLCLVIILCIMLTSCGGGASDESSADEPKEEVSEESAPSLTEQVEKLLEADKLITDIFVRGYFSSGGLNALPIKVSGEYERFETISKLVDDTYADEAVKDYFLAFPQAFGGSVYPDAEGRTVYDYKYVDSRECDFVGFEVKNGFVHIGDTAIPLVNTESGLKLGGSLYLSMGEKKCSPAFAAANIGSAAKLKGNIFILTLCFGTDGEHYPDEKAEIFSEKLGNILSSLEKEASEYGAELKFTKKTAGFDHKDTTDLFTSSPYELELILSHTTLRSLDGLVGAEMGDDEYDGYAVIVLAEGDAGCISKVYTEGESECFKCERVITAFDADASEIKKHLLYLFGADDSTSDTVMAYRVGWLDEINEQYGSLIK